MMYVVAVVLVIAAVGFAATIGRHVIELLAFLAMIGICIFICRAIANNDITSWGEVILLSLVFGGVLGLCYSPVSMVSELEDKNTYLSIEVAELRRKIDNLQGEPPDDTTAATTTPEES